MKKKVITQITAVSLAAVLTVPLSACSFSLGSPTPEKIARKVVTKMEKVGSVKENMTFDFDGTISLKDYDTDIDLKMNIDEDLESTADPYITHGTGTVDVDFMGSSESEDYEEYSQIDEDQLVSYTTYDDGDSWTKSTTDYDEEDDGVSLYNETLFQSIADGDIEAELAEDSEEIDGEDCYVLSATLTGDDINKIIEGNGMDSILEGIDDKDLEDVNVDLKIYVNESTSLPAKISFDMAEMGEAMFTSLLGDEDLGETEVDMKTFTIEDTIKSYDDVDEIKIPDDALDAEESDDSGLFDSIESDVDEDENASGNANTPETTPTTPDTTTTDTTGGTDTTSAEGPYADTIASAPAEGTADWTTMTFNVDGKDYTIPFAYSDIKDDWSFDLADYGYPDGYATNPGDMQYSTINLENDNYDMDFYVGFINTSDSVQDITENSIWSVDLSIEFADKYPDIKLPGDITWGSTLDQVLAAYGKPTEDPYYSENLGYYELTYDVDYDQVLELYVYNDGGLKSFSLKDYSL